MSFEIARSGINAVNGSLETISHNIANTGTYGYKSSRANFSAMYAGTQANGAEVSSVTQSMAMSGGALNTGGGMDAMIQGSGFFAVRDASGQTLFTRVGLFNVDKDGYVVDTLGRKLQGNNAVLDANGQPVAGAGLGAFGDLRVGNTQVGAVASDKLSLNGNLSADWSVPATTPFSMTDATSYNSSVTSVVYDSQGAKHALSQYYVKTGSNSVNVYYSFDGAAPAAAGFPLTFGPDGVLTSAPTNTFNVTPAGVNPIALTIDYKGTTQYAGDTTTLTNAANGNAAGTLTGTSLTQDGSVIATYSNGKQQTLGTVALANFANPYALQAVNDTSWKATPDSGTALYARPGTSMTGTLAVGAVEQSNVDVTSQLVDLMSAQRNYQANTKVISTESQMMQALMQAI
ncbi:flagellar hook protein FlgE [Roseateles sp.]|uniref:flagellar hook protein FlgE n=1 Tax=Roseateles sp. TaxID=1971397 RepID=UPI0025D4585E|nr:flagellar hook-basal body complex protein [Roseateles sp.]MBV8036765.1 flagellar hook-basal body complex protein [Roseateles sp.]